ncbi:TBC1 domain family member 15 [Protopterus annectens]|uniref:TBC1 domain family member 15 n=1 Tax=Protopterus annectens TaxID=7888 RepID=UPI001CFBA363|nr:TBC1 domain family member 15 [Protopterus annectens]
MGSPVGASFANLVMAHWETSYLFSSSWSSSICLYKRYLDDIFILLKGDEADARDLVDFFNSTTGFLKFTMNFKTNDICFLDTIISKRQNQYTSQIYRKNTFSNTYLHFLSSHPHYQKKSVKGQLVRLARMTTLAEDFTRECDNLYHMFRHRDYPSSFLDNIFGEVTLKRERGVYTAILGIQNKLDLQTEQNNEELLGSSLTSTNSPELAVVGSLGRRKNYVNSFTFVYCPEAIEISKVVKKYWFCLSLEKDVTKLVGVEPTITFKRGNNMKELLERKPLVTRTKGGTSKCGACRQCAFINTADSFSMGSHTFRIWKRFNCNSRRVVYLAQCKQCPAFYIGKTDRRLRDRVYEHGYAINNRKDENALAKHCGTNVDHSFDFMVIDQVKEKRLSTYLSSIVKEKASVMREMKDDRGEFLYEQDGVYIHSSSERTDEYNSLNPGVLRILDKDGEIVVDWRLQDDNLDSTSIPFAGKDSSSVVEWSQSPRERIFRGPNHQNSYEAEWDMVNTVSFKKKQHTTSEGVIHFVNGQNKWLFSFSLADLVSIRMNEEGMGWPVLTFCLKNGITLPALHFHHGGNNMLIECLKKYIFFTESPEDQTVLLVSNQNKYLYQPFENLLEEKAYNIVQKFKHDPYAATFGGFSKLAHLFLDTLRPDASQFRPAAEIADFLPEAISGLEISQHEEPGYEVIKRHIIKDIGIFLGSIKNELFDPHLIFLIDVVDLFMYIPQFDGMELFENALQDCSYLLSMEVQFLSSCMDIILTNNFLYFEGEIYKQGLGHTVRKEAWKFLLGYFPWCSTREERKILQKKKTDEYFRMKLQWKSVSEEQEKRNSKLKDYKSLIEKDVNRTDRNNLFYEGQDSPGLLLLYDILMTYCMYDFDLGYVQGMSDLLSPVLYVMENEVDAFWCFVAFMDQLHQNFEEHMQGMKTQLIQLSVLLRLLDDEFCSYLESQDSGYLYFCFRWLLIRFKREFSFQDILRLWEVMWTGLPCRNFHLLVCCAILDSEKQTIMENHFGFNEILKHINELSMKLSVEETLVKAEVIYTQMANCKELPREVCEIVGIKCNTEVDSSGLKNNQCLKMKELKNSDAGSC